MQCPEQQQQQARVSEGHVATSWTRGKFQRHSTKHETSVPCCAAGGPSVPVVDHVLRCPLCCWWAVSWEQGKRGTCFLSSCKPTQRSKGQPKVQSGTSQREGKKLLWIIPLRATAQLLYQVHCQGLCSLPAAQKDFGAVGPCIAKASQRTNRYEGGELARDSQQAQN